MTSIENKKQSTTRILVHCQDEAGVEGAKSTLAITEHWERLYANCSFLILTDLGKFNRLDVPAHVDYIHIPSGNTLPGTDMLRQTVFTTTLAHFDPHMLIVHYSPLAVVQKSHKVALYTRQHHPHIKIVLGLWCSADANHKTPQEWLEPQMVEGLQKLYDQIWLYTPDPLLGGNGVSLPPPNNGTVNGHGKYR